MTRPSVVVLQVRINNFNNSVVVRIFAVLFDWFSIVNFYFVSRFGLLSLVVLEMQYEVKVMGASPKVLT